MKQLKRSVDHRMIAGVCGGIGEAIDFDPNLIRLIFILVSLTGIGGIPVFLIYLVLWVLLPEENSLPTP